MPSRCRTRAAPRGHGSRPRCGRSGLPCWSTPW
jgi:hypothetical protein